MTITDVYGTSPVKRVRRTRAQIAELDDAIYEIAEVEHPLTVRSCFYRCVSRGAIEKTEKGYAAVQRRVLAMRRDGRLPYVWFSDGSRFAIRPQSWSSAETALNIWASSYRRALWNDQRVHLEIWSEKDAIRSTISSVTSAWQIPLMIARGYSSESFLWTTAEEIRRDGKPAVIYQLGDHDPSGIDAWRHTKAKLREFAPEIDFTCRRLAVTEAQIEELNLPTRPTKTTDTRAKNFEGESVEVDAIPSPVLRDLVNDAIVQWVDEDQLDLTEAVERHERDGLQALARGGVFGD